MKLIFQFLLLALFTGAINIIYAQESDPLAAKVYVVKGDYYNPPYEFINAQGEPDGFLVELFYAL
ncbi:MAG: hypothetical protein R6U64_04925, partial [Bacteroidales bacterium]